jgi:hypothetical protein
MGVRYLDQHCIEMTVKLDYNPDDETVNILKIPFKRKYLTS